MKLCWLLVVCCFTFLISRAASQTPPKVGQPLLCHGCVAVIKELHKTLRDCSGKRKTVQQRLHSLCQINNFVSYTFSPPKMIKACNYIVETHRKELENSLVDFYKKYKVDDNLKLQEVFCERVIGACEGVRRPVTDEEMSPRGLSMHEANERLNKMANDAGEPTGVLEAPSDFTTPKPKDEL